MWRWSRPLCLHVNGRAEFVTALAALLQMLQRRDAGSGIRLVAGRVAEPSSLVLFAAGPPPPPSNSLPITKVSRSGTP